MRWLRISLSFVICGLLTGPAFAQVVVDSMLPHLDVPRYVCPDDPPGNLASVDCSFTARLRAVEFVGGSVTDQAWLGAIFFGSIAQVRSDPPEWDRDWRGFGRRVGSRYVQNFAKGAAEFVVGAMAHDDPRHVSYASDLRIKTHRSGVTPRIGHAVLDWLSVRQSQKDGKGDRQPNYSLLAGALTSGFIGDAWYPDAQKTRSQAVRRSVNSLTTALASSIFNEFQPEVGRLLGGLVKRGRAPAQRQLPRREKLP